MKILKISSETVLLIRCLDVQNTLMSIIIGGVKINEGVGKVCWNSINGGVKINGGLGKDYFVV